MLAQAYSHLSGSVSFKRSLIKPLTCADIADTMAEMAPDLR